jgi:plastocyanin
MKAMKGARALVSGLLFLIAACAVPAVSAAQESASPSEPAATTTTLDQAYPPTSTTGNAADSKAPPAGAAAGTPGEPPDGSGTASPPIGDSPPADAPSGRARASASTSVSIEDFFFSPATVTVDVGDTVTWHNGGQAPHTATANDGSFDTGTVNAGGSASHRFTTAGTFSYICTIHPNMHGTIRVLSASGGTSKGASGGSAGSSSSSGSNLTEEQAVASPDAAGNSSTLPMTGMAAGALALVGAALLALGMALRRVRL